MNRFMTDSRKQRLLSALRESKGIVSTACRSASVPRRTYYQWLKTDNGFREAVEDIGEEATDFVESKLMENIEAGKERSILFYLKTRGKERGYSEQGGTSVSEKIDREIQVLVSSALLREGDPYERFMNGLNSTERALLAQADAEEAARRNTLNTVQSVQSGLSFPTGN